MNTRHLSLLAGSIVFVTSQFFSAHGADTYLGADQFLQKVRESNQPKDAKEKKSSPAEDLRKALKEYAARKSMLDGAAQASQWLGLFDTWAKSSGMNMRSADMMARPVRFEELMGVIPGADHWAELQKAAEARPVAKNDKEKSRELGLRLLVFTLNGDATKRQVVIQDLEKMAKAAGAEAGYEYDSVFRMIRKAMIASIDDPGMILKLLEQQLEEGEGEYGGDDLQVPNIVAIAGEKEAEGFLRRALTKSKMKLHVPGGTKTHQLAHKLALELVKDLKVAQWGLIDSLDSVALYEAMEKKFGGDEKEEKEEKKQDIPGIPKLTMRRGFGEDFEKMQARQYYLLALIANKQTEKAVKTAKELGKSQYVTLSDDAIQAMEKAGHSAAMVSFFHELLKEDPALKYWTTFVQLSANVGQTDRMLELVKQSLARKDLSDKVRSSLDAVYVDALLAADRVDEGVVELRRQTKPGAVQEDADEAITGIDSEASGGLGRSIQLARIGRLLDRKDWVDEGVKLARAALEKEDQPKNRYSSRPEALQLAGLLIDLGRGPEAEALLLEQMRKKPAQEQQVFYGSSGSAQALSMLAAIYNRAGRHSDVVTLFEQSEDWGVADLSRIYSQDAIREDFGRHFHGYSEPVGFVLANALIQTGRGEAARPIVMALLENLPGSDRGYELLAKLDGVAAVAKLDQLFGRDQFQERPLIWKAKLLLDDGKLAEAEEVVKKAVAIDPSDGEQGPDDRMRVYSVLADIREKRGDKKEAEFLRGAVKAIRLSEKADQFAIAGLLKRAIKMYQDSLNHFADAYCIQSRLAVQLSGMGLHSQAEAYYRKAYELMPDSFGRVESHCFGCEGVFAGERAQSIAEKVFTKLAKERPDKPQVHYLLGYLRAQQNRHEDAVPEFKKSVELDPEYLNAWIKMLESVVHVHVPVKQRDKIVLEILRLDPLLQHGHVDVENVSDLKALWAASERAAQLMPKQQAKLFELAASAKKLEQAKKAPEAVRMMQAYGNLEEQMEMNLRMRSSAMILRQSFVQAAVQLIGKNSMSY